MYRVGVSDRVRALHALQGDFGEESQTHAHEYRVEWICSALSLDENGFSVDIALLSEELARLLRDLEGCDLNKLEFFRDRQPSVENFAFYLHRELFRALAQRDYPVYGIAESEIRIRESESAWASYSARRSDF